MKLERIPGNEKEKNLYLARKGIQETIVGLEHNGKEESTRHTGVSEFRSVVLDLIDRWGSNHFWENPESVSISLKALYFTFGRIVNPTPDDFVMLESSVTELLRRWQLVTEKGTRAKTRRELK